MSTSWVFLVFGLGFRLTSLLSCPLCPQLTVFSASHFSSLLFRWRHQNEDISGSTLLHRQTRQNSAQKVQAVWGSPREHHCALVSTTRGEPLRRILYGSAKNYKQDRPNPRLEADDKHDGVFYLIINNVAKSDEATYYCACWDLIMSQSQKGPIRKSSYDHPLTAFILLQPQQTP